ncbi:MAG TPA: GIDE domain-containing protein [Anaerolineaceae bacterium]
MTNNIIAIFAWLGGACFCGLAPLGFAAVLFYSARKRGQVSSSVGTAKKTTVAALRQGQGQVRLQGRIAPSVNALDGSAENALVYLRLKVEVYYSDSDDSGWRGLTVKDRGIPFRLDDGSGVVWVNPDGLDKYLLGEGITPNDDQIQAARILLDISPKILRGQLRFSLWEFRAGQTVSVVGGVAQGQNGLEIARVQSWPFVVSPLLGQALNAKISTQTKLSQTWMLILGIPGAFFLLCGLGGALVSLIRVLMNR